MDSCLFSEHKLKCPNGGENKLITDSPPINQLESFNKVYVLHEHLQNLVALVVILEPILQRRLFEILESLCLNRTPMNTSVTSIPHILDEIKVRTQSLVVIQSLDCPVLA